MREHQKKNVEKSPILCSLERYYPETIHFTLERLHIAHPTYKMKGLLCIAYQVYTHRYPV